MRANAGYGESGEDEKEAELREVEAAGRFENFQKNEKDAIKRHSRAEFGRIQNDSETKT